MSWKKEAPETEAPKSSVTPDLSALGQPAPGKESTETAPKVKTPEVLLTPEAQGYINQTISTTVREIMAAWAPILEKVALTPEKLAEAEALRRAPDPSVRAREQREKKLMMEDEAESKRNRDALQKSCPHKYPSGASAINNVHNYPDRRPRGVCAICQIFLEPKRWIILAPDAENPRGKPVIAPAHELYHLVLEKEAQAGV